MNANEEKHACSGPTREQLEKVVCEQLKWTTERAKRSTQREMELALKKANLWTKLVPAAQLPNNVPSTLEREIFLVPPSTPSDATNNNHHHTNNETNHSNPSSSSLSSSNVFSSLPQSPSHQPSKIRLNALDSTLTSTAAMQSNGIEVHNKSQQRGQLVTSAPTEKKEHSGQIMTTQDVLIPAINAQPPVLSSTSMTKDMMLTTMEEINSRILLMQSKIAKLLQTRQVMCLDRDFDREDVEEMDLCIQRQRQSLHNDQVALSERLKAFEASKQSRLEKQKNILELDIVDEELKHRWIQKQVKVKERIALLEKTIGTNFLLEHHH